MIIDLFPSDCYDGKVSQGRRSRVPETGIKTAGRSEIGMKRDREHGRRGRAAGLFTIFAAAVLTAAAVCVIVFS